MDDGRTMVWSLDWHPARPLTETERAWRATGVYFHCHDFAAPSGTAGSEWQPRANASNDYLLDEQLQRTKMFSGIEALWAQDKAVQESMGAIVDRSDEHLTQSDLAIVRWRQKILRVARAYAETGTAPALDPLLHRIRPVGLVLDRDASWQDEIRKAMTIREEALA
jgi:hypothetical protein